MRHAKAGYYRNKIAQKNKNPKEAWKTINGLLGRSLSDSTEQKVNGSNITSTEKIANAFNEYFTIIGLNLANCIHDSDASFEQFIKPAESKFSRSKLVSESKV